MLEKEVDEKYYLSDRMIEGFMKHNKTNNEVQVYEDNETETPQREERD